MPQTLKERKLVVHDIGLEENNYLVSFKNNIVCYKNALY